MYVCVSDQFGDELSRKLCSPTADERVDGTLSLFPRIIWPSERRVRVQSRPYPRPPPAARDPDHMLRFKREPV